MRKSNERHEIRRGSGQSFEYVFLAAKNKRSSFVQQIIGQKFIQKVLIKKNVIQLKAV